MRVFAVLAVATISACGFSQVFTDNFNRADSPNLGANYDNIAGTATGIFGNEAGNSAASNNLSLVKSGVFTGLYSSTVVSADIRVTDQTSALTYVALALGHDGTTTSGHGIFIKIQRQVAGGFSHYGFYTAVGTNNTTAITGGGGNFLALTAPFSAARMTIWTSNPTTINLGIDTDFNGTYEQTYTRTLNFGGGLVVGNRVGLGVFGATGRIDNFKAEVVPEPATLAALGLGVAAVVRRRRKIA